MTCEMKLTKYNCAIFLIMISKLNFICDEIAVQRIEGVFPAADVHFDFKINDAIFLNGSF